MHKQTVIWRNGLGLGLVLTGLLAVPQAQGQATTLPAIASSQPSSMPTTAPASQPADNEYVKEFGIEKSQPYDRIFLFWNGKYIDTPIVVERRGLSVYINNIKVVTNSGRYPPRDLRVAVDPGEPPKDKSPLQAIDQNNPQNWLWMQKWHYFCGKMTYEESLQAIADYFKRSHGVTAVAFDAADKENQTTELKVTIDGDVRSIFYSQRAYLLARNGPDIAAVRKSELEDMQMSFKAFCADMAHAGFWFAFGLADTIVSRGAGVQIIHVLESDLPWAEKMVQLEQRKLLVDSQVRMINRMKDTYKSTPQLLQRIDKLEAEWAKRETESSTPVQPKSPTPKPTPISPVATSQASIIPTTAPASQPADEDFVKEFGIEKSPPYTDIFFFRNGKYMDTPIVVERRGLSVYLNNQRVVRPSYDYPPRDLRVTVDPGEPPADKSPWEAANPENLENWYWLKKWRYFCGQQEYEASLQAIVKVFQRSKGVTEVVWVKEDPSKQRNKLSVTADGVTRQLLYSKYAYLAARNGPDMVAAAQRELEGSRSYYRSFCRDMARGGFWFNFGLADTIVSERIGVEVIHVLESNLTWDEKMTQLEQRKLSGTGALNMFKRMKDTYQSTPQLLQRIRDLEAKWAQAQTQPKSPLP